MVQLPESIRPAAAFVAKYHFWLLALLVPPVLGPVLMVASGALNARIGAQRSQIESRIRSMQGVQAIPDHPNQAVHDAVEKQTAAVRAETLTEWRAFWESQDALRVWPASLGEDFLAAVKRAGPAGALPRQQLNRYRDTVQSLVRQLPRRMGADDRMASEPGGTALAAANDEESSALVAWSADDQRQLFSSFKWQETPSTARVMLAQEELWVYGLLCDAVRAANEGAAGRFNAAIVQVDQLAVGYPAAEETPGGQGTGRILLSRDAAAGPGDAPVDPATPGDGAGADDADRPLVRPPHPRFQSAAAGSGGAAPAPPLPGGSEPEQASPSAPASADDALREWIYVDFDGKPLRASELQSSQAARMVHLVPFTMRLVMSQQRLDALLAWFARQPVPIDVRQVLVTARGGQAASSPAAGNQFGGGSPGPGRPFDVSVELRGTVGLATPPREDAGAVQPPAASMDGRSEQRSFARVEP